LEKGGLSGRFIKVVDPIRTCQNPHIPGSTSPEVNHRFVYMKNWVPEDALTDFLRERMIVLGKGSFESVKYFIIEIDSKNVPQSS
jgi:hypothetical protein